MRTTLMCSSSHGDQPFNITWLKDQRIIYKSQSNNPNGARKQKSMANADDDTNLHKKNEHSYYVDSTIDINEYTPFSSILTIYNLTSNHNGNYTCQISNQGGVVDHTAVLSVAGS